MYLCDPVQLPEVAHLMHEQEEGKTCPNQSDWGDGRGERDDWWSDLAPRHEVSKATAFTYSPMSRLLRQMRLCPGKCA